MAKCAVIDIETNQQINFIVADVTDLPNNGTYLVEIPDGYYWDGIQVSPTSIPNQNYNPSITTSSEI